MISGQREEIGFAADNIIPMNFRQFQAALIARLQRGEQFILYGPRGSGKSTLLAARARLLLAVDRRGGVLLLDHVTDVSNAMLGYLRRLRGGVAAALLVIDVDAERERQRFQKHRLGMFWVSMPSAPSRRLRRLFRVLLRGDGVPRLPPDQERQIIRLKERIKA